MSLAGEATAATDPTAGADTTATALLTPAGAGATATTTATPAGTVGAPVGAAGIKKARTTSILET